MSDVYHILVVALKLIIRTVACYELPPVTKCRLLQIIAS